MSFTNLADIFILEGRMAETLAGSTVPRRQLGRYLRELRGSAGLTVRAAARELERSEPTLWRIENGLVAVRALDVEQMCRLFGATEEIDEGADGARQGNQGQGLVADLRGHSARMV